MIQNLISIYPYYIFLSIFIVVISIILFLTTKKYYKKFERIYSLFLNLNIRSVILIASSILNFTFILFFCFYIKGYNDFVMYLIIINTIISICVSLNIHIILFDILYTIITLVCLKLYYLVNIYINQIYYDKKILILGIIFMITILIYGLFIIIRKIELVLNRSRRRIKDE